MSFCPSHGLFSTVALLGPLSFPSSSLSFMATSFFQAIASPLGLSFQSLCLIFPIQSCEGEGRAHDSVDWLPHELAGALVRCSRARVGQEHGPAACHTPKENEHVSTSKIMGEIQKERNKDRQTKITKRKRERIRESWYARTKQDAASAPAIGFVLSLRSAPLRCTGPIPTRALQPRARTARRTHLAPWQIKADDG